MKTLMEGVDYVFHLAASLRLGLVLIIPFKQQAPMNLEPVRFFKQRENNVKRFIYSSTSAAYGGNSANVETQPDDCLIHILYLK